MLSKNNAINFIEFSTNLSQIIKKREHLKKDLQDAFSKLDNKHSGLINPKDFLNMSAYFSNSSSVEKATLEILNESCDVHMGSLNYKSFLKSLFAE